MPCLLANGLHKPHMLKDSHASMSALKEYVKYPQTHRYTRKKGTMQSVGISRDLENSYVPFRAGRVPKLS